MWGVCVCVCVGGEMEDVGDLVIPGNLYQLINH